MFGRAWNYTKKVATNFGKSARRTFTRRRRPPVDIVEEYKRKNKGLETAYGENYDRINNTGLLPYSLIKNITNSHISITEITNIKSVFKKISDKVGGRW